MSPSEMLSIAPLPPLDPGNPSLGAAGEPGEPGPSSPEPNQAPSTFDSIYRTYAPFVWRSARRLGVPHSAAEDVVQEVFVVVHRRLPEFEERTSVRAWLSAILILIVRNYRRRMRRRNPATGSASSPVEPDSVADEKVPSPLEAAERDEAVRELYRVLEQMKDERREVFVLAELEQLTSPEIAHALKMNVNTVSWRLRTARREFEKILFHRRAMEVRNQR